ncbi:mono/diheme cytochrome c family protein [Catalinimonas alkaloidigena]|uniref:cytochrome c n=1 Tax=Catalinimonas alkaloidigena TaxID=1075417 RepID=UPI002406912C|nr:cytochrome c [Catalinimonas alkaloidigena]MDF9797094.1 mono/diheme cytochrome c family protein [Catalinimonas alkaloidigena]
MKANSKTFSLTLFISLVLGCHFLAYAQRDSTEIYTSGRNLFRTHCNPCHGVRQEKLGPMLASITHKKEEDWLLSFINNSQDVILSGDAYANFLFEQYNHVVMPSFSKRISEREIKDILLFIENESLKPEGETYAYPKVSDRSNKVIMKGKALFNKHCITCHFVDSENIGPALGSLTRRRPLPWLIGFIRNSQEVIRSGDSYAVHQYNSFDQKVMPDFEYLSREEIISILDFVAYSSGSPYPVAGTNSSMNQDGDTVRAISSISKAPKSVKQEKKIPFKIILIVFSLVGASVHVFIIVKLYLYLKGGDYSRDQ